MTGATYDTGVLIAADRNDREVMLLHNSLLSQGIEPTVPAGVLAQAWRGGPQAGLSRLLKGCRVETLDEGRARLAGTACAAAGTSDTVDASVVAGAATRNDLCITSDPDDLDALASALSLDLRILTI